MNNTELTTNNEYTAAITLNQQIIVSAQMAQQNLYDMCMGLKQMRDSKLYLQLGYTDFDGYCETETGFKKRQVYNYISVAEKLPENFVHSSAQIGIKKLALLASLSDIDRDKITEGNDLQNTPVKALEQLVKKLKNDNEEIKEKMEHVEREAELDRKEQAAANSAAQRFKAEAERSAKAQQQLETRIYSLQNEISELENRPVEVAVSTELPAGAVDADEYRKICEHHNAELLELKNQLEKAQQDKQFEIEKSKAEYEQQLKQAGEPATVVDDKAAFKAYLSAAVDATKRLIQCISDHSGNNRELYITKTRDLLSMLNDNLDKI